jgi:hypothetical protein
MRFCALCDNIYDCILNRCHGNAVRYFGPCGITFMTMCVVTVAMVILLWDFGPCVIIFMAVCYNRCHGNCVMGFWAL